MCSPSAAIGGASKILSGIGQSKAIKAQNTAKRRAWERQMEIRKRQWLQNRTIYQAKTVKRAIDINENDLAANRAYENARAKLNAVRSKALSGNHSSFMKMVKEKLGKMGASGQTGRSAQRYETMVAAEYGRAVGKRLFGLTRAGEVYREGLANTRRAARSARNKLTEPLVPVPTMAPNYPPMQNSSMPIFQGILGAAGSAFGAMEDNPLSGSSDQTVSTGFDTDGVTSYDWGTTTFPTIGGEVYYGDA